MGRDRSKGSSNERHVRLYRYMWPELMARLDGNSFKALFYMLTFEDGGNNGQIFMGARSLGEGIGVDPKTALRCLHHLDRQGFIRPEQLGYFTQKGGPATQWRLTFLPANGRSPTNEWRQPPAEKKSWGENFPNTDGEIPAAPPIEASTAGESGTVEVSSAEPMGGETGTQSIASGDANPVELIRGTVSEWWRLATPQDRMKLAKQHGLGINELLDFVGGGTLPFPKVVAIRSAIRPGRAAA